jgi:hypothetical protein
MAIFGKGFDVLIIVFMIVHIPTTILVVRQWEGESSKGRRGDGKVITRRSARVRPSNTSYPFPPLRLHSG